MLLAEVRAGGAGALSRGPAEEGAAATSLTGADRGSPSGGALTWLPVHVPERGEKTLSNTCQNDHISMLNLCFVRQVLHPYLCYLPQGIRWWDSLVAVDAVALNGVRALWGRVARRHVGLVGC